MADESKQLASGVAALFVLLWSVLVTTPMWFVLLFTLLSAIEAPTYAWVLYWAYVPTHLIGSVLAFVFRMVAEA